jgi:uncharacterized alpha-E superfamily protein
MLSRVADNLYWMSRYVERAEGVTRLVEVNRDTDLESYANGKKRDYWQSALSAMCAVEDFAQDELERPRTLHPVFQGLVELSVLPALIWPAKMPEWLGISYRKRFG